MMAEDDIDVLLAYQQIKSQIGYWIQEVLTTCVETERCSLHMQHARDLYGWRTTRRTELLAKEQSDFA